MHSGVGRGGGYPARAPPNHLKNNEKIDGAGEKLGSFCYFFPWSPPPKQNHTYATAQSRRYILPALLVVVSCLFVEHNPHHPYPIQFENEYYLPTTFPFNVVLSLLMKRLDDLWQLSMQPGLQLLFL